MKYYIVINDELKMSKGKVARVCVTAGMDAITISPYTHSMAIFLIPSIVLRSGERFEELIALLNKEGTQYGVHQDAGHTQVPKGSVCSVSFFGEDDMEIVKDLRLY